LIVFFANYVRAEVLYGVKLGVFIDIDTNDTCQFDICYSHM
jgi:hypothetical protein